MRRRPTPSMNIALNQQSNDKKSTLTRETTDARQRNKETLGIGLLAIITTRNGHNYLHTQLPHAKLLQFPCSFHTASTTTSCHVHVSKTKPFAGSKTVKRSLLLPLGLFCRLDLASAAGLLQLLLLLLPLGLARRHRPPPTAPPGTPAAAEAAAISAAAAEVLSSATAEDSPGAAPAPAPACSRHAGGRRRRGRGEGGGRGGGAGEPPDH